MPVVSVVIPAYNAMTYLPETLATVWTQTFTDFEVILVDDGSTDHLGEWAKGITDSRCKFISQTHQGAAIARNLGISIAQGEYIAFLDADDLWHPTKLEKQVKYLQKKPEIGLVYTWTALINAQGQPTGRFWTSHWEGNVWERMAIVDEMIGSGSNPLVRRSCLESVGFFDSDLTGCQDWDMWIRIAAKYPFGVIKQLLTFYRNHPQGMSKNLPVMQHNRLKVIEKTFAHQQSSQLKNQAYSCTYLYQAWNFIDQGNYQQAHYHRQQALAHNPQLYHNENYLRLSLAIAMTRFLGNSSYKSIRSLTHWLHHLFIHISHSS
ncbi:glycosyltransferase family 2 protein [Calothrix sp. 336/3]|uniref:glycosyltransferase family 2 protein n=1 Tax=Calothrix sp. 336/3 TaxID=1337936 RepID=UPI0004E35987|nr:glycosyltransferase family A protein [Calothrix sp. 336/3]AKG21005.1 glycosyl transferase family A [Calothrix sp. 336/3]